VSDERGVGSFAEVLERPGVSPDLVALQETLWHYVRAAQDALAGHYPTDPPPPAAVQEGLIGGRTVTDAWDPTPPDDLLAATARLLHAVLTAAACEAPGPLRLLARGAAAAGASGAGDARAARDARQTDDAEAAGAAADAPAADGAEVPSTAAQDAPGGGSPDAPVPRETLARWFHAAWRADRRALQELAEPYACDADLLAFFGRQLARPFFQRLGATLQLDPGAWRPEQLHAGCPLCGGAPRIGRYWPEEGGRTLWCDLCDIEWRFPRVTCPFCLNRDHETLGFLSIAEHENYRIDVCDSCQGYLRAIDDRSTGRTAALDYLVEDVGTVHLGLAAEREGYRPGRVAGSGPVG